MKRIYIYFLLFLGAMVSGTLTSAAFPADTYASRSVLADGNWVKLSVTEDGMYRLTPKMLGQWGFNDPQKVRVFGYGGKRMDDVLKASTFRDDLTQTATKVLSDGSVVFFAHGSKTVSVNNGHYSEMQNIYSKAGYYFVTEDVDGKLGKYEAPEKGMAGASEPQTSFTALSQHELDRTGPGEVGPQLMGEDFRYTPTRKFTLKTPGIVPESKVKYECHFAAKVFQTAEVHFAANGEATTPTNGNTIRAMIKDGHSWAYSSFIRGTFPEKGENVEMTVEFRSSSVVYGAWLDYLALSYERKLALPKDGWLGFRLDGGGYSLEASGDVTLWDVTDPAAVKSVQFSRDGNNVSFTTDKGYYVAFNESSKFDSPQVLGILPNQNLHGMEEVEMVIFAPAAYLKEARRIEVLHTRTPENMKVATVDVEQVYNEFSSGAPDIAGLRNFLKMLYDRGAEKGTPLKYALLIGRATYDNRRIAEESKNLNFPTLPAWYTSERTSSLNENEVWGTDDYLGSLEDGAGKVVYDDELSIAVGRIPAMSLSMLRTYIDKLYAYVDKSKAGTWKNHIMLMADDEEGGTFLDDMEYYSKNLNDNSSDQYIFQKVYLDAYTFSGGQYPQARKDMFRNFDEGVAWWVYSGHANDHSMTGEKQFTFTDINSMYLRNVPFLTAFTCEFLKWDGNNESAGEILFNERYGGTIGVVSATRPAYITYNGYLSDSFARALKLRDEQNRLLTAGQIYRHAKNNIFDRDKTKPSRVKNNNRLRYVFLGDPAMRVTTPSRKIAVDSLGGTPTGGEDFPVVAAKQNVVIKGKVLDLEGNADNSFTGVLSVELFDAETSKSSNGRGEGKVQPFEAHGDKLFAGNSKVVNGEFSITVPMPGNIADNYRPAALNVYAVSDDGKEEAISVFTDFYIHGYDDTVEADTIAPKIESFYMNHEGFAAGNQVHSSPMVLAKISDNVGINLSNTGVGNSMAILIDGKETFSDASFYFTPSYDGSPSGELRYPISYLTDGEHTIRLRVWDTSGNFAEAETSFKVKDGLAPDIYEVYTDANPASVDANFYLRHNQPDCQATVTVTVYNLLGQPVWSGTQSGKSDMFLTTPVYWNLCDDHGRRVPRGIYVYNATITTDGAQYRSKSKKIAVTAR